MEAELADVASEELPSLVHDENEAGKAVVGPSTNLLSTELQYLEAVFGHGDADALQKVVVEVGEVVFLELISGQCQAVIVYRRCIQICFR